jgi:restriction system protein
LAVPKYNELYIPFLRALADGKVHTLKEIKETVADALQLTEDELSERIQSNKQTLIDNRLGWARTYLKKAGLLISEKKAHFQISEEGKHLLAEGVPITNELLAARYALLQILSITEAHRMRQPPNAH